MRNQSRMKRSVGMWMTCATSPQPIRPTFTIFLCGEDMVSELDVRYRVAKVCLQLQHDAFRYRYLGITLDASLIPPVANHVALCGSLCASPAFSTRHAGHGKVVALALCTYLPAGRSDSAFRTLLDTRTRAGRQQTWLGSQKDRLKVSLHSPTAESHIV